jgi:hypothetical protein
MKRSALFLAAAISLAVAGPAGAVICTVDDVPAATLLLPYFEVDWDNPNGITTLFSINNASATAVLAHVTLWTDLSVPVLDFNVYLTGYDVQSINLRDILVYGVLPQTASAGQDPTDTISPQGSLSQDVNFASCQGQLPLPKVLPPSFISSVKAQLTGFTSPELNGGPGIPPACAGPPCCTGQALGDKILRGYVTIDAVNNCTLSFPNIASYWANDATFQNVLWGDAFFVNSTQNWASGNPLVHIEAAPAGFFHPGDYTFAGRYVNWLASDRREPLATNFAVRFLSGGAFDGGSRLHVWRDSKVNARAFSCGTNPPWYPLGQEGIAIFDEQEQAVIPTPFPVSPPPQTQQLQPFPAETQSTIIGGLSLPVPYSFGWLYLDLNTTVTGQQPGLTDTAAAQAWVEVQMYSNGRYEVGFSAIRLDSACSALHFTPGSNVVVLPRG